MLYFLNVADWICTVVLLRSGEFYEANPLMSPVIGNIPIGFSLKCILPLILLLIVRRMFSSFGIHELRTVDRFVSFAVALYTAICILHIIDFVIWKFI